jgi:hypothetical protein
MGEVVVEVVVEVEVLSIFVSNFVSQHYGSYTPSNTSSISKFKIQIQPGLTHSHTPPFSFLPDMSTAQEILDAQMDLVQELFIPDQGACLPVHQEAEMLRVFANFRYRVYNDGDDTFRSNFRTKEVTKTKICDDAPEIAKSFFFRARGEYVYRYYEDDELSLDYLDPIRDALVRWVFAKYLPDLTPADAPERWKVVEVEQKARREAAYATWMEKQDEEYQEYERLQLMEKKKQEEEQKKQEEEQATKEAVKRKRAATLLAKKEAKEAANRKRAATLLAKGEANPRNKKQRV